MAERCGERSGKPLYEGGMSRAGSEGWARWDYTRQEASQEMGKSRSKHDMTGGIQLPLLSIMYYMLDAIVDRRDRSILKTKI